MPYWEGVLERNARWRRLEEEQAMDRRASADDLRLAVTVLEASADRAGEEEDAEALRHASAWILFTLERRARA